MTDLGLRFVRRPGPGGRAANLAALGATAIVALLLTFLIAGSLGLTHRSDRIGWRSTNDADVKTAVGAVNQINDMADGVPLTRYDVAINNPAKSAQLPPPPGLAKAPQPGEVYVSPEIAKHWSEDLAKRYQVAKPTGIISEKGLSSADELGRHPRRREELARRRRGRPSDLPRTWNGKTLDERMAILLVLVAFGVTLVLFPLLSLVGQAAGVAAKRREHRLAALRLAGATRSQVLWLSAVEQSVLGFLGAIAGVIGYTLLTPLIARIPLGGGTLVRARPHAELVGGVDRAGRSTGAVRASAR